MYIYASENVQGNMYYMWKINCVAMVTSADYDVFVGRFVCLCAHFAQQKYFTVTAMLF